MARTVIISGMIAGDPYQGGATWAVLQYVLGLSALGHDVFFVEPISPKSLQPAGSSLAGSANALYFRQVVEEFSLAGRAALLSADSEETVGLGYTELCAAARDADLLLNISGMLTDRRLLAPIRRRVYLDLDPAFVQLWQSQGINMRFAGHTHFVTIGQAIGEPGCTVPTCGLPWIKTQQPIVLDHWPRCTRSVPPVCTTVGNWRGYGSVERDGVFYGQKAHSLRALFELPRRASVGFRLALSIHEEETADLRSLDEQGWELVDPREVAGTPASYRQFIQNSWAELGIAKSGYVVSRCGWFSDRSIAYLASGRPIVAQQTGFSHYLPTGEGLLAFSSLEEAAAALERLQGDYPSHAAAARRIAEQCFAHDWVLPRLLERIAASPPA